MSNHVTEWLNAYLDGELHGSRLYHVEEHLAACEFCQAELESLDHLSALLQ
jgi:anti-sigma factor RsiW